MDRTPAANQGFLLGAGGILLATTVLMFQVRFEEAWSNGVHLALAAVVCAALFVLGARERFPDGPRAHQSVLLVSSVALLLIVVLRLGDLLADEPFENSLTIAWMAALFASLAAVAAFYYGSAVCTLFAAIGAATAVIAVLDEATAEGIVSDNFRFYLTALAGAFGAGSVWLRRLGRERHSVQLVNAAALTLIAIAVSFIVESFAGAFNGGSGDDGPGFATDSGWELVLMIGSFWILAYAALRREPGPAWLGALLLNVTAIVAAAEDPDDATIVGWPLAMLLLSVAALALAFRPRPPGGGGGDANAPTWGQPPSAAAPPQQAPPPQAPPPPPPPAAP